jgi:hypothetical protein
MSDQLELFPTHETARRVVTQKIMEQDEIAVILKFKQREVQDIIECATERGYSECGPMLKEAIFNDLYK